jgi:hypothetical protein
MENTMDEPQKKSGRGCLFYAGIVAVVIFAAVLLAAYMGYRYFRNLLTQYTDPAPITLPVVQMSAEDAQRARDRIQNFLRAVDEGKANEPLTITADEMNAVIQTDPKLDLKGHFYVSLEQNRVNAQVSVPAEWLLRGLRGRYFNGSGTFAVSLRDGTLRVEPEALTAKGKPVPGNFMRNIRGQNMAQKYQADPKTRQTLEKLESIEIDDGKLTITPKK